MKPILLSFLIFISLHSSAQPWLQIQDFTGTERDDGVAFVIQNTAYVGTGLASWFAELGSFRALNLSSETWSAVASLPAGKERQYACAFSIKKLGFVFGGIQGNNYLNDLWAYHADSNIWAQMTPLPDLGRCGAACFVINNTAYFIGGKTDSAYATNKVWAYNILTGTWQQKNNFPFGDRWRASATAKLGFGYLIFGRDTNDVFHNEFYRYNPVNDSWKKLPTFPGLGRSHAQLVTASHGIYTIAGLDSLGKSHNDVWLYNTIDSSWKSLDTIPALGRRGGVSFTYGSSLFYTTGVNQNNMRLKETWKYALPISIKENRLTTNLRVYPNPAQGFLRITLDGLENIKVELKVLDLLGQTLIIEKDFDLSEKLYISGLAAGQYLISVRHQSDVGTLVFVKE